MDNTIKCTACGVDIPLSDALTSELRASMQKEHEDHMKQKEQEYTKKIDEEKIKMWAKAQEVAKEREDARIKDLTEQSKEKEAKLLLMQEQELLLRREKRQLEEKAKDQEIEMIRKLDEEKKKMEEKLGLEQKLKEDAMRKLIEEESMRKMMEKDQEMLQLKKTIDELKRKSEQGSMQLQGDAQEENIKQSLITTFPEDVIADVATGVRGADLIQTVHGALSYPAGMILWESKNTKAWNKEWVKKLRDDAVEIGADVCVIVTNVLPEGISLFGQVEGVWVVEIGSVLPVASLLRQTLIEIGRTKRGLEGRDEKVRLLYEYLSGNQFKGRVENIVSSFKTMKEDLESEKRAFMKHWARREKQIERVITNTTGMYGDLEGLMGTSLAPIEYLSLDFGGGSEEE